jgi:hypothetical protein
VIPDVVFPELVSLVGEDDFLGFQLPDIRRATILRPGEDVVFIDWLFA